MDLHKLRKVVDVIKQWHIHFDFDEDALAEDESRFAQLLLAYNKAYFGDIRYTAESGAGSNQGLRATARVTSDGFVDRNGNVWRFPGLFFDAAFREPAVGGATALQVRWRDSIRPYPAFDADHPPISLDAFARVTRDALRAEAAVTSEVGKAVRGGSIFSTQNETLAASLEAAAGVIAKKLVEHGGFCYFHTIQQSERRKEGIKE
jgi:hypothetical protein